MSVNKGGSLDGGRELGIVTNKDGIVGSLFQKLFDGVNKLAFATGASAVGDTAPPPPVNSVQVKTAGEMMHISLTHTPVLNRGIHYFTEVSTSPSFSQAQGSAVVIHHGTSRTGTPIVLPTFKDDGVTKNQFYVRSYAQYQGSQPSEPTVVGGVGSPTAFTMTGTTAMTPLSGTGSGTGPTSGFSMGQGFGKYPQTKQ